MKVTAQGDYLDIRLGRNEASALLDALSDIDDLDDDSDQEIVDELKDEVTIFVET